MADAASKGKVNYCHRCKQVIYEKDKFGPVNGYIYHKTCFKCLVCDNGLTLMSYKTSQASITDKEVYCASHAPKAKVHNQMPASKWNTPAFERSISNRSQSKDFEKQENTEKQKQTVTEPIVKTDNLVNKTLLNTTRRLSKENLISETDKSTKSSGNNASAKVEANEKEISKILLESKKWSSKENLLSMNSDRSKDGRVASLTKKWSSRENLISGNENSTKFSSTENLLRSSKENLADEKSLTNVKANNKNDLDRRASDFGRYETKTSSTENLLVSTLKNQTDSNTKGAFQKYGSKENILKSSQENLLNDQLKSLKVKDSKVDSDRRASDFSSYKYKHSSTENLLIGTVTSKIDSTNKNGSQKYGSSENLLRSSQENLTNDKQIQSKLPNVKTSSIETILVDSVMKNKNSQSTSPVTTLKTDNKSPNQVDSNESADKKLTVNASKPRMIADNLGGINYKQYMEEVKRRQYVNGPKKNITDLYLKSPKNSRKNGSVDDLCDQLGSKNRPIQYDTNKNDSSIEPNPKPARKKLNVHDMLVDELNFYESFNHASSSYLNKDMYASDNRINKTGNLHVIHYENEILEKILSDNNLQSQVSLERKNSHDVKLTADDKTKIVVDFKAGGSTSSLSSFKNGDTYQAIPINCRSSKGDLFDIKLGGSGYAKGNETHRQQSKENIFHVNTTETTTAYASQNKFYLGRIMISYQYQYPEFSVTIHKAENLYTDKEHQLDTYVNMMLLPDPYKQSTCTTLVEENSRNPQWNQKFVYEIGLETIKSKYIYLSVKDHKMASDLLSTGLQYEALKLISLGEALIPLNNTEENMMYEFWVTLKEPSDVQDTILAKDL